MLARSLIHGEASLLAIALFIALFALSACGARVTVDGSGGGSGTATTAAGSTTASGASSGGGGPSCPAPCPMFPPGASTPCACPGEACPYDQCPEDGPRTTATCAAGGWSLESVMCP